LAAAAIAVVLPAAIIGTSVTTAVAIAGAQNRNEKLDLTSLSSTLFSSSGRLKLSSRESSTKPALIFPSEVAADQAAAFSAGSFKQPMVMRR
jgi:hypothetical protein